MQSIAQPCGVRVSASSRATSSKTNSRRCDAVNNVKMDKFAPKAFSFSSSSVSSSGLEINAATDATWAMAADNLPETVTINGVEYKSADLNGNARKLLSIYLADQKIVGQQKELVALAELGLKSLLAEIESNLPGA